MNKREESGLGSNSLSVVERFNQKRRVWIAVNGNQQQQQQEKHCNLIIYVNFSRLSLGYIFLELFTRFYRLIIQAFLDCLFIFDVFFGWNWKFSQKVNVSCVTGAFDSSTKWQFYIRSQRPAFFDLSIQNCQVSWLSVGCCVPRVVERLKVECSIPTI